MKIGDIVERNGQKYIVTNVYTLCGGIAYDTDPFQDLPFEEGPIEEEPVEPKKKRTRTKK